MRDPLELVALRAQIPVEEVRKLEQHRTWTSSFVVQSREIPQQRAASGEEGDERDLAAAPDEMRLTGYSAVFDSDSELLYGFIREQVKRGAFKKVLKAGPDVRLLENHEGRPHARTTNGTLKLWETPRGLARDAVLDTRRQDSRDLYYGVERGDYSQSSFAFTIGRSEWRYCEHVEEADYETCDCVWERDILEVSSLVDDSVVTYPAYPAATAEVARSASEPAESVATQPPAAGTSETVARDSEPSEERHVLASDEEQHDTASDTDTSQTPSVSGPTNRELRLRLAKAKGSQNVAGNHGGAR